MNRFYKIMVMVGIAGILYQLGGSDLPTNQAMLLVGVCCGIAYAVFSEVKR